MAKRERTPKETRRSVRRSGMAAMTVLGLVAGLWADLPELAAGFEKIADPAYRELVGAVLFCLMVAGLGGALIWLAWTIWRIVHYVRTTPPKPTQAQRALMELELPIREVISGAANLRQPFERLLEPVRLARHLKLLDIPCPPDGDRDMWGRFAVELLVLAETGNLKKARELLAEVENDPNNG